MTAHTSIVDTDQQQWLTCRIDEGMFSDEVAVTYPDQAAPRVSVFVPRSEVQGATGGHGRVRVRLIERQGSLFAILPTQQRDIVLVSRGDVEDVA
ncbi:MAG: hypothetical protein KDA58_13975 [Planctomycetaceae bacterium]|nr:hypothetical protein [Planctomycetaceae bacterium]